MNEIIKSEGGVTEIQSSRAMQEVKAMIFMAHNYPRSPEACLQRIKAACKRKTLAESAIYSYPRGGKKVTGPSIRLAEVIAQNWQNIDFGLREISQYNGMSEIEAYAWDLETNVRQTKTFKVAHKRHTTKGAYALDDPRDIYEMVANQGARRLRACILGVIPGDIIDDAVRKCEETLKKADPRSTADIIRSMVDQFEVYGVTVERIEARLGHKLNESTSRQELVDLGKIYNSIKDGMSGPEDWFPHKSAEDSTEKPGTAEKKPIGDILGKPQTREVKKHDCEKDGHKFDFFKQENGHFTCRGCGISFEEPSGEFFATKKVAETQSPQAEMDAKMEATRTSSDPENGTQQERAGDRAREEKTQNVGAAGPQVKRSIEQIFSKMPARLKLTPTFNTLKDIALEFPEIVTDVLLKNPVENLVGLDKAMGEISAAVDQQSAKGDKPESGPKDGGGDSLFDDVPPPDGPPEW